MTSTNPREISPFAAAIEAAGSPFVDDRGIAIPICSPEKWGESMAALFRADGLTALQVAEGCGYSMAMVVRFALGLSAHGGAVTAFVTDTFYGWITLATARHLLNAGGIVNLIVVGENLPAAAGPWQNLFPAVQSHGARVMLWNGAASGWDEPGRVVESSHNVLCGFSDSGATRAPHRQLFADAMNESAIPVHSVGVPAGTAAPNTPATTEQYSSSTLSLGLPLDSLVANPDLIGRHYVCDVGWSLATYESLKYRGPPLFAEQPVKKILSKG